MKKRNTILKKFIALSLCIPLILTGCAASKRQQEIQELSEKYAVPNENQLIVYTSHKEEVYLPIIREFENRTGIWVDIVAGGTAEMMQKAQEASENARCDIMFGGGIESYEAHKNLFMPYVTSQIGSFDSADISSDGTWTAFTQLPIVFIYNDKLVSATEAPRKLSDLFDDRWKGQIAFADPGNSGTSYTILSTMEQNFGESIDSLVPRFYEQLGGKILKSSGQIIPMVSGGSYLIGITLEETAKKYMSLGYNISMIYPSDGTSAVPDGCAIIKNAPHSYNAGLFIDFVVGYDTQKYVMENFYRRPVRTDITLNSNYGYVKVIPFDIAKSAEDETYVFELWNSLTKKED